jgi:glutathione peroxidase
MTTVHDFTAKTIAGETKSLADYKGQVLLIVNVASQCGFTPQYEGLEALEKKYGSRGFHVLGFPSNQFGAQEPGDEKEIARFCTTNYGVDFPMFAKIDVNGETAHPLYKYLQSAKSGVFGSEPIKWNFTKFLVGKDGQVVERYGSSTKPESLTTAIEKLLT